jgi:hypothetical protein
VTNTHLLHMAALVHARLDPESERQLVRLRRTTGLTDSELVRRGLLALAALPVDGKRNIVGVGCFASGKRDLGSNRAHLRGFGHR